MSDSLRPSTNWGQAAKEFSEHVGAQKLLCVYCVTTDGSDTPPTHVLVYQGQSVCLIHFKKHLGLP
jgi:hypothetical protein